MGILKRKYADPATCEHKRTVVVPPKTGVSAHEKEVCRDCGKIIKVEQPRFHKTKTKSRLKKKRKKFLGII